MNKKEKGLAALLLKDMGEFLEDQTCNDLDKSAFAGWSKKECDQWLSELREWDDDANLYNSVKSLPDWIVAKFLAHKLKQESES